MKRMGIGAIYRQPNTSKPAPGHKIYPYLLRGVKVERPNQVWATDITYIPMARGFVYLVAVVDWFSRRVLSHRVSITMETGFCIKALEEAIGKYGKPEIFNSGQGGQFTSEAFTGVLLENEIAISMDGKGSWRDNVFVERLWRSVKYEEVYLKAYDTVANARASLGRYLDVYNRQRPHSSLDRRTPDEASLHTAVPCGGCMKVPPPHRYWASGRATPSLRPNPYAAKSTQTRQNDTYQSRKTVQTNGASSPSVRFLPLD